MASLLQVTVVARDGQVYKLTRVNPDNTREIEMSREVNGAHELVHKFNATNVHASAKLAAYCIEGFGQTLHDIQSLTSLFNLLISM